MKVLAGAERAAPGQFEKRQYQKQPTTLSYIKYVWNNYWSHFGLKSIIQISIPSQRVCCHHLINASSDLQIFVFGIGVIVETNELKKHCSW